MITVRAPDADESVFFDLPDDGRVSVIETRRTAFDGRSGGTAHGERVPGGPKPVRSKCWDCAGQSGGPAHRAGRPTARPLGDQPLYRDPDSKRAPVECALRQYGQPMFAANRYHRTCPGKPEACGTGSRVDIPTISGTWSFAMKIRRCDGQAARSPIGAIPLRTL